MRKSVKILSIVAASLISVFVLYRIKTHVSEDTPGTLIQASSPSTQSENELDDIEHRPQVHPPPTEVTQNPIRDSLERSPNTSDEKQETQSNLGEFATVGAISFEQLSPGEIGALQPTPDKFYYRIEPPDGDRVEIAELNPGQVITDPEARGLLNRILELHVEKHLAQVEFIAEALSRGDYIDGKTSSEAEQRARERHEGHRIWTVLRVDSAATIDLEPFFQSEEVLTLEKERLTVSRTLHELGFPSGGPMTIVTPPETYGDRGIEERLEKFLEEYEKKKRQR